MVEFMGGPTLPYDPSYHLLWRIDKIHAAIRRQNPDVLEIHSPYVAALSSLTARAKRTTFFWHSDFIDTYGRVLHVGRALSPLWAWVRHIASRCDRTIVTSADQEEKLVLHRALNVVKIPMGVDRALFRPAISRPSRDEKLLVGAGRFAVEKQWDVVIDAVIRLRKSGFPVRLVLYGDGPERKRLEARALNGVKIERFERDRSAMAAAIASADAYVHGCPYETFGVAIAEAVSCEVPIVVPNRGAAREHVRGAHGRTYEAGNPEACAAAIRSLFEMIPKEREKEAKNAAKHVMSIDEHFDRLLALYESLC